MQIFQLTKWQLVQNTECVSSHYHGYDSSQNFQSELESAQDESKGCHIESVFLWTNLAFQSKHFISKLNPRLTDSALIQKNNLYERKWLAPQNIVDSEHFRVRRDKANTLRIKTDSILD